MDLIEVIIYLLSFIFLSQFLLVVYFKRYIKHVRRHINYLNDSNSPDDIDIIEEI